MSYQEEIWRDIEGYEGIYQVSNFGKVKRLEKEVHKNIKGQACACLYKEKIMKLSNHNRNGYLKINLNNCNISKTYQIHRLVAQAFIPNLNKLPQVNHKDGNKKNNKVENLEWVSVSDNHKHAYLIRIKATDM